AGRQVSECSGVNCPCRHNVAERRELSIITDKTQRAWFPVPADAAIKPLDSSARNPLICMVPRCGLCGLRASFRERGRREKRPGESGRWPRTGPGAGRRSPQASAGIPANTRESARSGKKKPQPRTVGVSLLVEVGGIEPPSEGTPSPVLHAQPA